MTAKRSWLWSMAAAVAVSLLVAPLASSLTPTQTDDFEDGTVANWIEGGPSPNMPTNVPDGGPMGAGDNYLENISSGTGGPGGRLAMFNDMQWACDFNAAGSVITLAAEMANFGATPLAMRMGVQSGSGNLTRFVSTNAAALPADGVWRTFTFTFSAAEMTRVLGDQELGPVLDDVAELRILSAAMAAWQGDQVAATLGVDNVRVESLPVGLESFSVE